MWPYIEPSGVYGLMELIPISWELGSPISIDFSIKCLFLLLISIKYCVYFAFQTFYFWLMKFQFSIFLWCDMGFCNNNWLFGGTCCFWGKCLWLLVAATVSIPFLIKHKRLIKLKILKLSIVSLCISKCSWRNRTSDVRQWCFTTFALVCDLFFKSIFLFIELVTRW